MHPDLDSNPVRTYTKNPEATHDIFVQAKNSLSGPKSVSFYNGVDSGKNNAVAGVV